MRYSHLSILRLTPSIAGGHLRCQKQRKSHWWWYKPRISQLLHATLPFKKEKNVPSNKVASASLTQPFNCFGATLLFMEYIIIAKLSNNVEIVFDQAPFRVECYWVELKGQMLDWKSSLMKAKQVPTRFCTRQTADSASTIKVKLSNNQLSNTSDKAFIFQLRRNTLKSEMIELQPSKNQIINQ